MKDNQATGSFMQTVLLFVTMCKCSVRRERAALARYQ
jgi:hypothetical protein